MDRDAPYEDSFNDFVFDGTNYTIRTLIDEENRTVVSHDYKYLMRFEGPKETPDAEYDYFERYVLTNSADVTWEDILAGRYTDYYVLALNPIGYQKDPALKQNITKITLEYKGEVVGQVTSPNTCALIREILSRSGEYHMEDHCACTWYSVDEELQMVFWYDDGSKDVINPIRGQGVIVFGDYHYAYKNYGDGTGYETDVLLGYFGLSSWPR